MKRKKKQLPNTAAEGTVTVEARHEGYIIENHETEEYKVEYTMLEVVRYLAKHKDRFNHFSVHKRLIPEEIAY